MSHGAQMRARIVFLIHVPAERQAGFLEAYEQIRYVVSGGVAGHIRDQVCQSSTDPEQWLITSEWRRLEDFVAWEATDEHCALVAPMRACFTGAQSLRFLVCAETSAEPMAAGTELAANPTTTRAGEEMTNTDQTGDAVMSDVDLRGLLLSVGLDPEVDVAHSHDSLETLGLDSLALMEVTARLKDSFSVDLEEEDLSGVSPATLRKLVNSRAAARI